MYTYTRLSVCMKTLKKFYFFDKNLISFIVCFSVVFFEHLAFNFYNNEKKIYEKKNYKKEKEKEKKRDAE